MKKTHKVDKKTEEVVEELEKQIARFDLNKVRMLHLFSLFGSPMMKNHKILNLFVDILSMICGSTNMHLTSLQLPIDDSDIKCLVALISDHVRCNDAIFAKLNAVTKSIMHVPANKYLILRHVVSESHRLSESIVKELKMIHNIIAPDKSSSNRFTKSWTISSKQNALLRNIEFFNALIDIKVAFEFDFYKENFKDKTKKKQNKEKKEDENEETKENLKEKRLKITRY